MRRFRKPKPLSPEDAQDPEAVRLAAIALLARRDYASGELQLKLESRGYPPEPIAAAVAEMVAGGIVNDARYAENYVSHHAGRGEGPRRIEAELRELKISSEIIDAALKGGPDWRARAREIRIRRFGAEVPESWAEKAKQGRFLQYRGFSSDHIRAALGPDFDPNE